MPVPVVGDASSVLLGPGAIYIAPIGTAEPVSASGTLDAAYVQVGYTQDGNTFTYTPKVEPIEVAELLDPIAYASTSRETTFEFNMAQSTRRSLAAALNLGVFTNSAQGFGPPALGSEVRIMMVFDGQNGARFSLRRCFQGGAVAMKHQKAPDYTTIPVAFTLEIPTSASAQLPPGSTGFEPFWYFPTSAGLAA